MLFGNIKPLKLTPAVSIETNLKAGKYPWIDNSKSYPTPSINKSHSPDDPSTQRRTKIATF